MENITDRIKYLVDTLVKSKAEFGRKIGTSGAAVTKLYYGNSFPSGSTITAICSVFGVNRTWLETGEGEPFKRDEVSARVKKNALPGAMVALVEAFEGLTEEEQLAVLRFVDDFAEKVKREQLSQPPESPQSATEGEGVSIPPEADTSGLSEAQRSKLAEIERQMLLENKAAAKSSDFSSGYGTAAMNK